MSVAHGYDTALRPLKGQWHGRHPIRTATRTATCTSVTSTGMTTGGTGATTGWTTTGTATTPLRCWQLSSLLTPHLAGLSFGKLAVPSSEHLTNLLNLQRQSSIFLIIQRLRFPQHHEKKFQSIYFSDGESHIWSLILTGQEARGCYCFYTLNEQCINTLTQRMSL